MAAMEGDSIRVTRSVTLSPADIERRTEARSKALFIHNFMDPWDLDVARLKKCCTHYALPDGRLITVKTTETTTVQSATPAALKDLAVGTQVSVTGTPASSSLRA